VKLVYLAIFNDVNEAIAWEKKVKRWSRAKKEALIRRDYLSLPGLSLGTTARQIRALIVMVRRTHHDNLSQESPSMSS
jgi:hypothetical protein